MIQLTDKQAASLKPWFLPDRPGPLVGLHVINSGHGQIFADRWPQPRVVLANANGNMALAGDPEAWQPADLRGQIVGMVDAPPKFRPLLESSFPDLQVWRRVILTHEGDVPQISTAPLSLRRLRPPDDAMLREIHPDISWISTTWSGVEGLASSELAWAAFDGRRIVSVACTFFVGETYEEIGVVTEPAYRGRGLSYACAAALCGDIYNRKRRPSWSTSPDNMASLRVAQKLGFQVQREDILYVIGIEIPEPSRP